MTERELDQVRAAICWYSAAPGVEAIRTFTAEQLHCFVQSYNCNDGLLPLHAVADNPRCDRGTLLATYWQLHDYLFDPDHRRKAAAEPSLDWNGPSVMDKIERRLRAAQVDTSGIAFDAVAWLGLSEAKVQHLVDLDLPPAWLRNVGEGTAAVELPDPYTPFADDELTALLCPEDVVGAMAGTPEIVMVPDPDAEQTLVRATTTLAQLRLGLPARTEGLTEREVAVLAQRDRDWTWWSARASTGAVEVTLCLRRPSASGADAVGALLRASRDARSG